MKIFILFCVSLMTATSVHAMGGKIRYFENKDLTPNWIAKKPQFVVALGFLETPIVKHYQRYLESDFKTGLLDVNPEIQLKVIPRARGREVVEALNNPDTIGFVFISHTYQTDTSKETVLLGSDGHPLPVGILSAATPALRYASFFGCHGASLIKHYQVDFETQRLAGNQLISYNDDRFLSANFMRIDHVKKLLKKELRELSFSARDSLHQGIVPDHQGDGELRVRIKDVYPGIEPRYVSVNDRIVGVLGTDPDNSNSGTEYRDLTFSVPARALETDPPGPHQVQISSAELTPGVLTDNYLIENIELSNPNFLVSKAYTPAWRIGDEDLPKLPYPFDFSTIEDETSRQKALAAYLADRGIDLSQVKDRKERQRLYHNAVMKSWRAQERLERDPTVWEKAEYRGRFFIDSLTSEFTR